MNSKYLKVIIPIVVILIIGILLGISKIRYEKKALRFYNQGVSFYKQKKYSDAYYNFKQVNRFSKIYNLALLKEFQCANLLGDKKTALVKISELSKRTKNIYLKPYLLYNEANLAQETGTKSDSELIKCYKYIYNSYPENDYAIASAYKIAKIESQNKKNNPAKIFIKYLSYAPNGKFALDALEELNKSENRLHKDECEIVANAYFLNEKYESALKYYEKTDFSKNWVNIAKCYRNLKDYQNEKNTISNGLNLKTSQIDEKDLGNIIDRYITLNRGDKKQILENLYTQYSSSFAFPSIAYKLAESTTSIRSIKIYEHILKNFSNSIWASNSAWEVFWYNYKLKRYKVCKQIASIHMERYTDMQDAPRIAYWLGRIYLEEKQNQQAKDMFYKIIKKYPLSYYAFLSSRQLKISKAKKIIVKKPIADYDINLINKFLFEDKILLFLADENDYQTIDDLKINDTYIKSWVANKKENYPYSIKIAKDEITKLNDIDFSLPYLKLAYPVLYNKEINSNAKQTNQSPYLYMSLIKEESHFDKNAKSSAGAVGLSQLLPTTASFIEKKNITDEILYDIDKNIKIGMDYFAYLAKYFKDNQYLAILAYNAGPGNIVKWIENPSIDSSEIDIFIENIPYLETKNYIKKILSTYWIYINIYSPKNR